MIQPPVATLAIIIKKRAENSQGLVQTLKSAVFVDRERRER
jgi:hypothetical protein